MSQALFVACTVAFVVPVLASAAGCSASDQAYIESHGGTAAGSFGQTSSDCGHKAFSILSGFSTKKFSQCITAKTNVSESCSSCYAAQVKYGCDHCKLKCLTSWCSSSCLACSVDPYKGLNECIGFPGEKVKPCDGASLLKVQFNMTIVV